MLRFIFRKYHFLLKLFSMMSGQLHHPDISFTLKKEHLSLYL